MDVCGIIQSQRDAPQPRADSANDLFKLHLSWSAIVVFAQLTEAERSSRLERLSGATFSPSGWAVSRASITWQAFAHGSRAAEVGLSETEGDHNSYVCPTALGGHGLTRAQDKGKRLYLQLPTAVERVELSHHRTFQPLHISSQPHGFERQSLSPAQSQCSHRLK